MDNKQTMVGCQFFLHANTLDFNAITKKLAVLPTEVTHKSETKISELAEDYWSYNIPMEPCDDISEPIQRLIEVFIDKADILLEILQDADIKIGMNILIDIYNDERPLMLITGEQMSFFGKLHCPFAFDILS